MVWLYKLFKVHIFWEGHKILRNLPLTFDWHYIKVRGRFRKFFWPSQNTWTLRSWSTSWFRVLILKTSSVFMIYFFFHFPTLAKGLASNWQVPAMNFCYFSPRFLVCASLKKPNTTMDNFSQSPKNDAKHWAFDLT